MIPSSRRWFNSRKAVARLTLARETYFLVVIAPVEAAPAEIQHLVDHLPLAVGERRLDVRFPERGLVEHPRKKTLRAFDGPGEAAQKPSEPFRYISISFLASLEDIIVFVLFLHDLRGDAVIPDGLAAVLGQSHIGQGAGDPAVPIVKWVNGNEPEMGDRRPKQALYPAPALLPPFEKAAHLIGDPVRGGRLENEPFRRPGGLKSPALTGLPAIGPPRPSAFPRTR